MSTYIILLAIVLGLTNLRLQGIFAKRNVPEKEPFDWGPFCNYHQSLAQDKD